MKSASVEIKPTDHRCKYWAKIVRAGVALPLPSAVNGANDIPGAYSRKGDEEIFPGDFLIEGEENHHRHIRGWSYWISFVNPETGEVTRVSRPSTPEKTAMKANGLPVEYLSGAGGIAACVRVAHAVRLNISFSE